MLIKFCYKSISGSPSFADDLKQALQKTINPSLGSPQVSELVVVNQLQYRTKETPG